jgi:Flp pilus assembly protein TadG
MDARRSDAASAPANRHKQRGAAAIEFALIAAVLFTLLIGTMEMGRILFYWNTATEATRLGARLAVVCDKDAAVIKTRMNEMLPILDGHINIAYASVGGNIQSVTVSVIEFPVATFIPFVPLNLRMPSFATTLQREIMSNASGNPDCIM